MARCSYVGTNAAGTGGAACRRGLFLCRCGSRGTGARVFLRGAGGISRLFLRLSAGIRAVKTGALEGHPDSAEDFPQRFSALGAGGEGILSERLLDIKSVIAGRATVRIGGHGVL